MTGRLIAVVGPSGVGKDSLISGLCAARPGLVRVRRAITRPASGTEPFEPVTPEEFDRRRAAGAFALSWEAHGLGYGIPASARTAAVEGHQVIANLSRAVLARAGEVFPALVVLSVTAPADILAQRLAARGREDAADIAARLARSVPIPGAGVPVIELDNGGPLAETIATALSALDSMKALDA